MAQVIREAKIIVHLEQGKVELKAPQINQFVQQQERQVELTKQLGDVQNSLNSAIAEGAKFEAAHLDESLVLRKKAVDALQAQEAAMQQARESQMRYYREAFEGANMAGEGFFRLGRAAVLLGASSDESFQRMIRSLAMVQGYYDLFKGSIEVVLGLQKATQALAAAQGVATVATGALTTATNAQAAANTRLLASLGPIALVLAAIAVAYSFWKQITQEQEEAQRRLADAIHEQVLARMEAESRAFQDRSAKQGILSRLLFGEMTPQEQLQQIDQQRQALRETEASIFGMGRRGVFSENLLLDTRIKMMELNREERNIRQSIIQERQRELELAIRARDVEQEKLEAFRAQFGLLTAGQRARLENITDRIRAGRGDELTRRQLEMLGQLGGRQGQAIATDILGRRGQAAGADDVFRGIRVGMVNVEGMQREVDRAHERLADSFGEFGQNLGRALKTVVDEVLKQTARLNKLETAAAANRR